MIVCEGVEEVCSGDNLQWAWATLSRKCLVCVCVCVCEIFPSSCTHPLSQKTVLGVWFEERQFATVPVGGGKCS